MKKKFFYFYDRIVDIADRINRKRAQQAGAKTSAEDRDAMFSVLKETGFNLFGDVMDRIREDAVSGILKMDILIIAGFYGRILFRHDFSTFISNAQILHAVVSKLTPAEMDELDIMETALGDVFKISPENCNKALELSESNLAISRSERTALQRVLYNSGWLEKSADQKENPEVKEEAKRENKIVSITSAVEVTMNSEEKKRAS